MTETHLVVDGSNIATEGRTAPSLAQLNDAVTAFIADHVFDNVVVVVDATFPKRIESSERAEFEAAVLAGEILTPPAGAVGRGDAFVLQIAERSGASVLSNDSFQEFHGLHDWLFDDERLWGGKPVPGVGWVFVQRTPVRGPTSRRATKAAKAGRTTPVPTPGDAPRRGRRSAGTEPQDAARKRPAKSAATKQSANRSAGGSAAGEPAADEPRKRRRRKSPTVGGDAVNGPAEFLAFVTEHPLDSVVEGTVSEFSSHGAYVMVGPTRCYVSLKSMGNPAPRSPRDVLQLGEVRSFTVRSVDTPRRGVDLMLSDDDVVDTTSPPEPTATRRGTSGGRSNQPPAQSGEPSEEESVAVKKKAPAKRKAAAKKKAPARRR